MPAPRSPWRHAPTPASKRLRCWRCPVPEADGTAWRRVRPTTAEDTAIVQYTSGSTGLPRGVLVRHGGVAANTAAIADRFRLTPMVAGIPARIMPPGDFLKSPLWWLRQIVDRAGDRGVARRA